ncbi:MAG: FkbM family methyltransferase [Candidatus Babeliales bacterium]|nr:FkbM family methyltransferase [Candidatus Babeliales bacterium]
MFKNKYFLSISIIICVIVKFEGLMGQYYSQFGQDKYISENIFKSKKKGVFFDIGAFDGVHTSNTYFLEKNLNWTGICVEPQPEQFKLLKNSRKCICIEGCIYKENGEQDFLKISGPVNLCSGLVETYESIHGGAVAGLMQIHGGTKEVIKVKTYNFNFICKKYNISHIDFLSIDTEGSEEDIIRTIDFDKVKINTIAVENNYNNQTIRKYLESKNFIYKCRLGVDDVYVNKLIN